MQDNLRYLISILLPAALARFVLLWGVPFTMEEDSADPQDEEGNDSLTLEEYDFLLASMASNEPGQAWRDNQNKDDLKAYLDEQAKTTLAEELAKRKTKNRG